MPIVARAPQDIIKTVAEEGSFGVLASALKAAGLAETLKGAGPFTIFAPTDQAFAKIAEETLQEWFSPQGRTKLRRILTYHLLAGRLLATEIVKSSTVKTVQGTGATIRFKNNTMHVNNAKVLRTDVACDNGVIHVLDTVLVPR